jgi:hypothetical protein
MRLSYQYGSPQSAIRARDVRAADLQEKPAKRIEEAGLIL